MLKTEKMPYPRIKIFTRSFDLRLYRLAKGLFCDWKDAEGRPIPCVRLTDQSADGYFFTMLKDTDCDVAINIDENEYRADFNARAGRAKDLVTGKTVDFGGGLRIPGYTGMILEPY